MKYNKFKIAIELGNSAMFSTGDVVQALKNEIITKMENGHNEGFIFDTNGNKVGEFGFINDVSENSMERYFIIFFIAVKKDATIIYGNHFYINKENAFLNLQKCINDIYNTYNIGSLINNVVVTNIFEFKTKNDYYNYIKDYKENDKLYN